MTSSVKDCFTHLYHRMHSSAHLARDRRTLFVAKRTVKNSSPIPTHRKEAQQSHRVTWAKYKTLSFSSLFYELIQLTNTNSRMKTRRRRYKGDKAYLASSATHLFWIVICTKSKEKKTRMLSDLPRDYSHDDRGSVMSVDCPCIWMINLALRSFSLYD